MTDAVLAAERARAAALVARDLVALEALLHDELVYVHATGVRHDRGALLRFVQQGPSFLAVELGAPRVRRHGELALVTGELHLRLQREPDVAPVDARSLASAVWLLEPSGAWRLLQFQSTRVAA
jgi:ketosteroid isomerase-like protein